MDTIIQTLRDLSNKDVDSEEDFEVLKSQAINIASRGFGEKSKHVKQLEEIEFKLYSVAFIGGTKIGGGSNLEKVKKELKGKLIAFADELKLLGKPQKNIGTKTNKDININVSQHQK